MKLLVVGAGEMGRWVADALAAGAADPPAVAFTDTDPGAAAAAADGAPPAVDARSLAPDADERFDVVCFAVPIPALGAAVEAHADRADRALVDVTGVMAPAVDAMAAAAPTTERVSFHPLFAAANAPGNVAVVADAPGPATDRIRRALSAAGNDLFETTAAEHDTAMETVQARTHAAVLAFGLAAEDVREEFQTPVSAALFDVLDQVTGNDPRVYADIQASFDGADDVAAAAERVAAADTGDTEAGTDTDAESEPGADAPESFAALYRAADRRGGDDERQRGGDDRHREGPGER